MPTRNTFSIVNVVHVRRCQAVAATCASPNLSVKVFAVFDIVCLALFTMPTHVDCQFWAEFGHNSEYVCGTRESVYLVTRNDPGSRHQTESQQKTAHIIMNTPVNLVKHQKTEGYQFN